jgi:hypothetical protein
VAGELAIADVESVEESGQHLVAPGRTPQSPRFVDPVQIDGRCRVLCRGRGELGADPLQAVVFGSVLGLAEVAPFEALRDSLDRSLDLLERVRLCRLAPGRDRSGKVRGSVSIEPAEEFFRPWQKIPLPRPFRGASVRSLDAAAAVVRPRVVRLRPKTAAASVADEEAGEGEIARDVRPRALEALVPP